MRGLRDREEGSTHVLEAVLVVSVMLTSVAFVVTMDLPANASMEPRTSLDRVARDALSILNDTPVRGSDFGDNVLELAIHECLQNACERLEERMGMLLPDGSQYAVYLSTQDGLYPVRASRTPPGEAVTARHLIEPEWSYQFLAAGQSVTNPVSEPLVLYSLPVFSGNPLDQGGYALRFLVYGERVDDESTFRLQGAASTRTGDAAEASDPPAISAYFVDAGSPVATLDVTDLSIVAPATPTEANITFTLRLEESGGATIPAGTTVTIHAPRGWEAGAVQEENDGDWLILSNATDTNGDAVGSVITARLLRPISSDQVDLVFDGIYYGDTEDQYPFVATLSAGAYGKAQLLVRADAHAAPPPYEAPLLVTSVPRPIGSGATTTWTLGAAAPYDVRVTRIDIVEESGADIFAGVDALTGPGAWASSGDTLTWTGNELVTRASPLELAFTVDSAQLEARAIDRASFLPTVDIGAHESRLLSEIAPGMYRGVFAPSGGGYRGYDASTGTSVRETHAAESAAVYRATPLPGAVAYDVGYGVPLEQASFASVATPRERRVNPGEDAVIDMDVQSAAYTLARLGFEPTIDMRVYPPWGGETPQSIVDVELYNASLASGVDSFLGMLDTDDDGSADASTVGQHEVTIPIPEHYLYGPYVVEARLTWLEELSRTVDGVEITEEVMRSTSVYDYFIVEPSYGPLPPSAVYDVHLVAWFDEWG